MKIAIVGTREPSPERFALAKALSHELSERCHTIATGGAFGIDQAAMEGARSGSLIVYLPWAKYNQEIIPEHATRIAYNRKLHRDWTASVKELHPSKGELSHGVMCLMARNYGIIEESGLVIAMPKSEGSYGGTNQAIRIAMALGIHYLLPAMQPATEILKQIAPLLSSQI